MQFVDTNVFVRHLINDDLNKAIACREIFQAAGRNEIQITTSESVIAEVVFVISSPKLYNVPRDKVRALLYPLLTLPGLRLANRHSYLRALDLYVAYNIDFEDAMSVAHMERQGIPTLLSYDRDFDRIGNITRQEPGMDTRAK